jgi:hypothetical protein
VTPDVALSWAAVTVRGHWLGQRCLIAGLPSRQRNCCCPVPLRLKLFLELVATDDMQQLRKFELSE